MKQIQLTKKKTLILPSAWGDLDEKQLRFAFKMLMKLYSRIISPEEFRMKMLIEITGYRPSNSVLFRSHWMYFRFYLTFFWKYITKIPFLFRFGWKEYQDLLSYWNFLNCPQIESVEDSRDIINYNLSRLSGYLDFMFSVEENQIIPNHRFNSNPFPYLKIGRKKCHGKKFILDVIAKTDITAAEFRECFDMISAMEKTDNFEEKNKFINQVCAIIYPFTSNFNQNLLSGQDKLMQKVDPVIKFGILFWFTGIAKFYMDHPVYSILFSGSKEHDETKISLGMSEITLRLKKEGLGDSETMNLNTYFDAQIKLLKDSISGALAKGASLEKIAEETGISIITLNRLS